MELAALWTRKHRQGNPESEPASAELVDLVGNCAIPCGIG
jgi:hypothetical protein